MTKKAVVKQGVDIDGHKNLTCIGCDYKDLPDWFKERKTVNAVVQPAPKQKKADKPKRVDEMWDLQHKVMDYFVRDQMSRTEPIYRMDPGLVGKTIEMTVAFLKQWGALKEDGKWFQTERDIKAHTEAYGDGACFMKTKKGKRVLLTFQP